MEIAPHVRGGSMITTKEIAKLFFESEDHRVLLDTLRSDTLPHVYDGMAQLIEPDGTRGPVVTKWFADKWCKDHKDWRKEAL
jgi:hypothetical protein